MNKYFKYILFVCMFLVSVSSFSKEVCPISKLNSTEKAILSQILHNKNNVNEPIKLNYAIKLSKLFLKAAIKYKVPASHLAAIGFIESNYIEKRVGEINPKDIGLMQINIDAHSNLDLNKLLKAEYNIDKAAEIYSWFYKTYTILPEAVKRYNCGTAKNCVKKTIPTKYWNKFLKAEYRGIDIDLSIFKKYCK